MNKLNSCEEIVVYGFAVAGWNEVRDIVFQSGRICYGYSIDEANQRGANGRNFFPVGPGFSSSPEDSNLAVKRQCKQMLTAIVAENCLREREGRSVIPVIFCLESNLCPLLPPEAIADKKHPASGDIGKIGSAEIRRMFKLCTEEDLPEEVRLTARKTFYFIKIRFSDDKEILDSETVPAPWERPGWKALSEKKNLGWRKDLMEYLQTS